MEYILTKKTLNITATIIVAVITLWATWVVFVPTSVVATSQKVSVGSGQSLTTISRVLKNQGLIRSAIVFRFYVASLGLEKNLKAGDYTVPAGSNLNDIASQISGGKGNSNGITVFIPEGSNIWEIDKRMAEAGLIEEGQFASAYGSREGYLFPDTYQFDPKSLLGEIEQKMEDNGQKRTADLLGSLSILEKERILIIASIIEKEARSKSDMYLVSGVISNRIELGMDIEIDATVAYGACLRLFNANPNKDCDVTQIGVGAEIKIDSAYNTYTRPGLPPRPISNPGLNSIEAALNPTGDYFYYLSTRDGNSIIFAKTGVEHVANRRKYLGL